MELVILNIGLEIGMIARPLFTMMVLMAVATTVMASPLFDAVRRFEHGRRRPTPVGGYEANAGLRS